jgi:hypothetical protein
LPLINQADRPIRWTGFSIRPLDVLIIVLSAVALVALSVSVYGGPAAAVVVVASGGQEWMYPLSQDREIAVQGVLGITSIHINDGMAHIEDSPCTNKTCIASPPIRNTGDWSACLPNGVFIRIEGSGGEDELDATVR